MVLSFLPVNHDRKIYLIISNLYSKTFNLLTHYYWQVLTFLASLCSIPLTLYDWKSFWSAALVNTSQGAEICNAEWYTTRCVVATANLHKNLDQFKLQMYVAGLFVYVLQKGNISLADGFSCGLLGHSLRGHFGFL